MTDIERGKWYPDMPPALVNESPEQYTDRLTGADGINRSPYDHSRKRQCSIGYHLECTGGSCECPCHSDVAITPCDELDSAALQYLHRLANLPMVTCRRILAHVGRALSSGEAATMTDVRTVLEDVYESRIGLAFIEDVVHALGYRERKGKLVKK